VQHSTDQEPGIRQNPGFTDRSGLGNLDHRVNYPDVLAMDHHESRNRPRTTS
jgi:hypothetical protein